MAYNDIDSGKVLNKEGLLELSGQIKGYINTNMPESYVLPTASTSTLGGVKVDGDTITITDGVISANGSGGASYTAGNGIDIDSNNVISKVGASVPMIPLLLQLMTNGSGQYNQNACLEIMLNRSNMTEEQMLSLFKTHHFIYAHQGIQVKSTLPSQLLSAVGDSPSSTFYYVNLTSPRTSQYTISAGLSSMSSITEYMPRLDWVNAPILIIFNPSYDYGSNYRWIVIKNPEQLFQNIYFNSKQGLTSHSMAAAIDEVASKIPNIPSSPSTDGTYILKSTVSSGAATNSWESVTIGGSY